MPLHAHAAATDATQSASAAPTTADVLANTIPLIRPRLRVPKSLHQVVVVTIQPTADDPERFQVEVSFRATSPFGATAEHRAKFHMKRSASGQFWIVTAD
ncbi:MAG: hypothetical protein Q7J29_02245 [Stagnimonas sp.]|nr:hypothetical protein [Stagnimonas sp.]